MEVAQALVHAFTLPPICRHVVYVELARLVSSPSVRASGQRGDRQLKYVLEWLRDKVLAKLAKYFVPDHSEQQGQSTTPLAFMPSLCAEVYTSLSGQRAAVSEDVSLLLALDRHNLVLNIHQNQTCRPEPGQNVLLQY